MKKNLLKILLVFFILLIFIYVLAISSIPESLVIFEGEEVNFKTIFGLDIDKVDIVETSSSNNEKISDDEQIQTKEKYSVSLFDNFLLKEIDVDVLPKQTVIPVGNIAGLKLYTSGVLVVGMSEIQGMDNLKYKPYIDTGIEEGDTIIKVNNAEIFSTEDLMQKVNSSNGNEINITYIKDEEIKECSIMPVETDDDEYKLGLWVRDSAAGVGTVTFYDPTTQSFAALGHGISDIDTNELLNISSGEFITTRIVNIVKGEEGNPGKIQGTIDNQENIGEIYKNTEFGIFGKVDEISNLDLDTSKEMELALREEIQQGKATILCNLDNTQVKEYDIEIERIYLQNDYDNKSMKIKITDEELLNLTGGIIQGMSGAPIIQNGKFIGAVTNVLVNNPKEGFAVFGDIMLKEMKAVE